MANKFEVKRDGFFGISFARFVIEKKNIYLVGYVYVWLWWLPWYLELLLF